MNVLWIEDFGELSATFNTVENIFHDLINQDVTDTTALGSIKPSWDSDYTDQPLNLYPVNLTEFFQKYSAFHNVTLCRHYTDFITFFERLEKQDNFKNKIDIVIIDINLSDQQAYDDDQEVRFPSEFKTNDEFDEDGFNKKAGFYIFNFLLNKGFPVNNMCLLTGEIDTYRDFQKDCSKLLMPKPKGFEKTTDGYKLIRNWINEHKNSEILQLKRGILEGIEHCSEIPKKDPNNIRLKDFMAIKKNYKTGKRYINEKAEEVSEDYICNYFELVKVIAQTLANNRSDDCEYTRNTLVRAIVHEWDNNTHGYSNERNNNNENEEDEPLVEVLNQIRNSISHGNQLGSFDAKDCALLFLISMRLMVRFDSEDVLNYENKLFRLLCPITAQQKANFVDYMFEEDKKKYEKLKRLYKINALYYDYNISNFSLSPFVNQLRKRRNINAEELKERIYKIPWYRYVESKYTIKNLQKEIDSHFEKQLFVALVSLYG